MFRNRILILSFLLMSVALSALAQRQYYEPEYTLGARGGATASFVSFSPNVKCGMLYGAQAGVAFRYISDKYFGIQIETNFSQRGWTEKIGDYNYSRQLSYIEIPFLSHIYFRKDFFRWFFNLGPQISFRVMDSEKTDLPDSEKKTQHTEKLKNIFDYGIQAGTGFEFQTKRAGIYQLEARYSFGFGDLFPNSSADTFKRSSNQNISLCLGILFNL